MPSFDGVVVLTFKVKLFVVHSFYWFDRGTVGPIE